MAAELAEALRGPQISVLEGPPGVGKSYLAQGVGAFWERGGGSVVIATGESLRSDVAFHPLRQALTGLPPFWKQFGAAGAGLARAGEILLGTAGVITSTVELLVKARARRRGGRTPYLGDVEQELLHALDRMSDRKPLLLVADNLHYWDVPSLALLRELRAPATADAFPFLADMRLLAVQTPEPHQSVAYPEAHEALLVPTETEVFRLPRIERAGFATVLAALGAGDPPAEDVTDRVWSFTGGHLALAGRCARRLATEGRAFLTAKDADDFVRDLLTERLRSLGPIGRRAVGLLQVAAVVGYTFRRDELACAAGGDESETARLLRECREEALLELSEDLGWFVHDVYQRYFLAAGERERVTIHEKLSECLRLLRPGDYDLRCVHALGAERPRHAAALAVQAGLQREREAGSWRELPPLLLDAIAAEGMEPAIVALAAAHEHLNQYRFEACLEALDELPGELPKSLLAEGDYLRASCLMSTRSDDQRARARWLLDDWTDYEHEEPELGIRLMRLHVYGLAMLGEREPAKRLEQQLKRVLRDRAEFDDSARDALYALDRAAGSLEQPDPALRRNRRAVAHFGPRPGQTMLRRPVEYYRALVNLGANLIANARYEDARGAYAEVERLVAAYAAG
nr:AAA family ATPase [Actinomycetota bacterium]